MILSFYKYKLGIFSLFLLSSCLVAPVAKAMDEPIREETAPPPPQMRQPDNTYLTVDPYDHSHNNIEIIRPAYQKDKSIFYNNDYYAYQLISCHHNIMKGSSLLPWEADPEINDTDVSTESTEEFEDEFSDSFEEGNKREKDH